MSNPKISMIAAVSLNAAIGKNGGIPWSVPEDLKFFREYTMNKVVIMGARTANSLKGPLPGRCNIVVCSNPSPYSCSGFLVASSVTEALETAKEVIKQANAPLVKYHLGSICEIVFVGGARIYEEGMKFASKIVISRIHVNVEGADAFFPHMGIDWDLDHETEYGNLHVEVYRKLECC
jgi:dihydrofolate reductase